MSTPKKIALAVLGVLALLVAGVLILAASKPDEIHVERKLVMRGSAAEVLPYISDYQRFITWMPWAELDPNQSTEFSQPSSGVGAWYTWAGNDQVGRGRMEVLSAEPNRVVHELHFIEPFESLAETTISTKPVGEDQVEVTWALDQRADFLTKVMCVFMDMDAMVGADFERGLSNLQKLVEGS